MAAKFDGPAPPASASSPQAWSGRTISAATTVFRSVRLSIAVPSVVVDVLERDAASVEPLGDALQPRDRNGQADALSAVIGRERPFADHLAPVGGRLPARGCRHRDQDR